MKLSRNDACEGPWTGTLVHTSLGTANSVRIGVPAEDDHSSGCIACRQDGLSGRGGI